MIRMTDKELVEFIFKIADWHENTCSVQWDWIKDSMFYILDEILYNPLIKAGIWETYEGCHIANPMGYWHKLIEEFIKERAGEDSKTIKEETKKEILKELKKIEKMLENENDN